MSASALSNLKSLLSQTFRVSVSDGRTFIGTFAGTDQLLNILVVNAEEYRAENPAGRYVGQVMIPWKFVVSAEVAGQLLAPTSNGNTQDEMYS